MSLEEQKENPPDLKKPHSVEVELVENELTLTWRWYSRSVALMAFCCLPMLVFVGIAYLPIVQGEEYNWMSVVIPLPFLLLALLMGYASVAGFLNTSTLSLDEEQVDVQHGPIPWLIKPVSVESDRIERFLVTQVEGKKKNPKFALCAQVDDEKVVRLLNGLPNLETAYFLKEKLQEQL